MILHWFPPGIQSCEIKSWLRSLFVLAMLWQVPALSLVLNSMADEPTEITRDFGWDEVDDQPLDNRNGGAMCEMVRWKVPHELYIADEEALMKRLRQLLVCKVRGAQKTHDLDPECVRKLTLAGLGEIKHAVDQLHAFQARHADDQPAVFRDPALREEIADLKESLRGDLFRPNSLYGKTLKSIVNHQRSSPDVVLNDYREQVLTVLVFSVNLGAEAPLGDEETELLGEWLKQNVQTAPAADAPPDFAACLNRISTTEYRKVLGEHRLRNLRRNLEAMQDAAEK